MTWSSGTFPVNTFLVNGSANLVVTIIGPNGSSVQFATGSTPSSPTVLVPAGSNISVFFGGTSLTVTQSSLLQGAVIGTVSAQAAAIATEELKNAFGTDSVVQVIEYAFTGDVGNVPPMDHKLEGDGILSPDCVGGKADSEKCQ